METFSLTPNISVKSLSNLTTKDSFRILKMSWFRNWHWLFDLIKNWRRYWGLKRSLPIHGRMNVPCGKYLTFSDSGTLYCRVCSVDRGFRVRIPFVAGLVLWSERVTFRNIKLILKTNASYILTSIISNWLSPLNLKCVFNLSSEQILD